MVRKKAYLKSPLYFQGIPGIFMMALLFACISGLIIALILLATGNFNLNVDARSRIKKPGGVTFCTEQYLPVCGSDGKTYSNQCFALRAGTTIAYEGTCSGSGRAIPAPVQY